MVETEGSVLVAMAPLSEAAIRCYAQYYCSRHPGLPLLTPSIEELLEAVGKAFDQEWAPILAQVTDEARRHAVEVMREERLDYERKQFFAAWQSVIAEARELRARVYTEVLRPVLSGKEQLTSKWLVRRLGDYLVQENQEEVEEGEEEEREVSQQTLWRWRDRGLLFNTRHGHPDFDSTTALFMLKLSRPTASRGFLPRGNYRGLPIMYCYRKDFPQSPLVACGLPLESNSEPVPRHALLLSPLSSLARFHQDWLVFKGWSVRWAGTVPGTSGELYWDLSEEDIALWDPDVQAYQKKIMGEVRFARHTLASLTLLVWASQLIDDGMAAYSLPDLIAH